MSHFLCERPPLLGTRVNYQQIITETFEWLVRRGEGSSRARFLIKLVHAAFKLPKST